MARQKIDIPLGYRIAPELKSERIQLLIRPSIKEAIKARADKKKMSLNEYINEILENTAKKGGKQDG